MPPNTDSSSSTKYSHRKYPEYRLGSLKSPHEWLEGRQGDDNAEGLWRIYDELYDVSDWIHKHPGGAEWLILTKGTDITEAFESHHLSNKPELMLKKFHVRHTNVPRNSTFTFEKNGFYMTLKRRVAQELEKIPKYYLKKSTLTIDGLLLFTFIFSILATRTQSWIFSAASGVFLTWTIIAAHNFFHQKDNFRMYYFNLSLMSVRDWRISHVISHHLHTNTLMDLEISKFDPLIRWLPTEKGPLRYGSWLIAPLLFAIVYFTNYLSSLMYCLKTGKFLKQYLIPLSLPTVMYALGGSDLSTTLNTWLVIILIASFFFGCIGFNAAHHHPKIFHDGDTLRADRDWGKFQLDTVVDRNEITGSRFLVLTHFGDHALHHLFPTIDHSLLPFLYPVVNDVCNQFNVKLRFTSIIELVIGQMKQAVRIKPNPKQPDCTL